MSTAVASQPSRMASRRDGPAAGKRVEHLGGPAAIAFSIFCAEPLERLGVLRFPAPVQDAAFGFFLDPLDDLAIGHLLLLDFLDDLAAIFSQSSLRFSACPDRQQRGDQRRAACRQRPPAGQMCSVEICPWRTFFSWTESSDVCFSGNANSISRGNRSCLCILGSLHHLRCTDQNAALGLGEQTAERVLDSCQPWGRRRES